MHDGDSGVCNLGNNTGYSVREVIETARRVTGHPIPAMLVADSGKVRRELGWQPQYESLETIVRSAWQWHQRNSVQHTIAAMAS